MFIASDEPFEVRRRQTFDRLKYPAERAGSRVEVKEAVLYIIDVAEFSLTEGFLCNSRHG